MFSRHKAAPLLCLLLFLCAALPAAIAAPSAEDILSQHKPLTREDLERIYQYRLDRGAANLSVAACYVIRASKRLLQEGNLETALIYAEYAVKIAPDYPPAHTHLAAVRWSANMLKVDALFEGLYGYLRATLTNYGYTAVPLTKILIVSLFAVLMTIVVFSLVSLYKYFKLFTHDLGHLLPSSLSRHFSVCCAVLIFSLPVFFKWGISITALYVLLFLFIYHTRREQQLIIICTLFFFMSPFILQALSQLTAANASKLFYYTYQVNEDNWGDDAARVLAQRVREHPHDTDAAFSLALINKREGRIDEARRLYDRLLERDPLNFRVLCNLGNTYLADNNRTAAIEYYKRAIEICPDHVEGYYNLSRVQLLEYMFAESKINFNKARKLDPDRVDTFLHAYSENMNRMVIDQTIPLSEFWQRTFTESPDRDALNAHLWGYFFRGIPYKYRYGIGLVALLFAVLLFADRNRYRYSLACEYCGCAVCRKCRQLVLEHKLCKQCAAIFKTAGDVMMLSVSIKEARVAAIEKFQGRKITLGKLLSISMPGSGHLLFDHPLKGTALLFLFFLLIFKLLMWNDFVVNPWQLISGSAYLDMLLVAIPLFVLYLYALGSFNFSSMKPFQFLSLIRVTRRGLQIKE